MCVIADKAHVLGLGGVMGGEPSGCTEATTDIFIESAYFDPLRTAATGRKTGINSDARYRFERGIDPRSEMIGLNLATKMILEFCGGEPSAAVVAGRQPDGKAVIVFDPELVQKLSGANAAAERASARTWCPASSACSVVSNPMPLLAPMINTRAMLILHAGTASIAPAILEQKHLR